MAKLWLTVGMGAAATAALLGSIALGSGADATRTAPAVRKAAAAQAGGPVYFHADSAAVGDPNPIYEKGVYSVFYLRDVGRHPLWVSQSADLARWSRPHEAVPAGEEGSADFWVGSGSMVADPMGGYRLFYTGHNPQRQVAEVVMTTHAQTLAGPWRKDRAAPLAGSQTYSSSDFRDPDVVWNPDTKSYWLLVTTRTANRAAIGLYASPDLAKWSERPPLYTVDSPLNLEVPDLFDERGEWYLLYSDQRENAHQVRYLRASQSTGPYHAPTFDALDGRAFYAGKSAGPGDRRLLFGWIAHKVGRSDTGALRWGGDLVFHSLHQTSDGDLAVSLPSVVRTQFDHHRADVTGSRTVIGSAKEPLLIDLRIQARSGTWLDLRFTEPGVSSVLHLDMAACRATFLYNGSQGDAPSVSFPCRRDGAYQLALVTDPYLGLGVAYIDGFRALSFRYYGLGRSTIMLAADAATASVRTSVSSRS